MKILFLVLLIAFAGLLAYIRLAPSPVARWHVDLAGPELRSGPGSALVRVGSDIESPVFSETADSLLMRLDAIARATPRTHVLAGGLQDGKITYITRSKLWGFPDYTTVKAVPVDGGPQAVIYGRLRFGQSDHGVNRARILGWLKQLAASERT